MDDQVRIVDEHPQASPGNHEMSPADLRRTEDDQDRAETRAGAAKHAGSKSQ
jgi:hypothetical protein